MRTTLYAATSNAGKLRDFAHAAHSADIDVLPLPGLAHMPEPVEDAATFSGNADLKAVAYSRLAPGLLVFADDSGLAVDALDGRPGVLSARFADSLGFQPETATPLSKDDRNNRCLLTEFQKAQQASTAKLSPAARFLCTLSLARDGEVLLRAEGSVEGELIDTPRGNAGFGYDPLFFLPNLGLTMAEVAPEQKWALSHRGNAFRNLIAKLKRKS